MGLVPIARRGYGSPMASFGHVYSITCVPTGHVYIGQTSRWPEARWREHLQGLKNGRHCNQPFLKLFKTYGEDAFVFRVVTQVPIADLDEAEFQTFSKVPRRLLLNVSRGRANIQASRDTRTKTTIKNQEKLFWFMDGFGPYSTNEVLEHLDVSFVTATRLARRVKPLPDMPHIRKCRGEPKRDSLFG